MRLVNKGIALPFKHLDLLVPCAFSVCRWILVMPLHHERAHRRVKRCAILKLHIEECARNLLTFPLCCFDQISCWLPKDTS